MSVRTLTWVLDDSDAPGNDRLVLIAIADEADDDGLNAYPSIDRIARRARVNKRTTMRALERLEASGELVIMRPEKSGRGHFNRYALVMGRDCDEVRSLLDARRKGDTLSQQKGRATARNGAHMRAPDPLTYLPEFSPDGENGPSEIEELCSLLADRVEQFRGGSDRPAVTERWRQDMRLLVTDGPLKLKPKEPMAPDAVRRAITFTFDELAEPGKDGFCWAKQVQSPNALRRHMPKIREERRLLGATRVGRGAQAVDRVTSRLQGGAGVQSRQPLGLLGEHEPKEITA